MGPKIKPGKMGSPGAYRIIRINTVDLFYADGQYFELLIDHREVVLGQQPS
jgi:hypothetical protein